MQENSEMHSRAAAAEAAYAEMQKTLANAKESVTRNLLEPWPLHHRIRASLPRTTSPVTLIGSAPCTTQGHNQCTSHEERLVNVRADFPLEAAAEFADLLGIDGSWTMHLATNDVVAAFRRVACADPRVTIL